MYISFAQNLAKFKPRWRNTHLG